MTNSYYTYYIIYYIIYYTYYIIYYTYYIIYYTDNVLRGGRSSRVNSQKHM